MITSAAVPGSNSNSYGNDNSSSNSYGNDNNTSSYGNDDNKKSSYGNDDDNKKSSYGSDDSNKKSSYNTSNTSTLGSKVGPGSTGGGDWLDKGVEFAAQKAGYNLVSTFSVSY